MVHTDCHSAHWVSSLWHRAIGAALPLEREEEKHVAPTGVQLCQSCLTAAFGIAVRYERCVRCQSTSSQTGIQIVCMNNNISSEESGTNTWMYYENNREDEGGKHSSGQSCSLMTFNRKATYVFKVFFHLLSAVASPAFFSTHTRATQHALPDSLAYK